MSMKDFDEMRDLICDHVKEINDNMKKRGVTDENLDQAYKTTKTVKNIFEIDEKEDGGYSERSDMMPYSQRRGYSRDGYSRDGDWEARGRFGHSYDEGGSSYAGRRRDAMGRYSRDDGKAALMSEMEAMMQRASGQDRETIRRAMDELRNA